MAENLITQTDGKDLTDEKAAINVTSKPYKSDESSSSQKQAEDKPTPENKEDKTIQKPEFVSGKENLEVPKEIEDELISILKNKKTIQKPEFVREKENLEVPKEIEDEVISILKNKKTNENNIFFKTLDFAGQPVYNVIHPLFLSSKAIYILVHGLENDLLAFMKPKVKHGNSERELEEHFQMTSLDNLEFWLSCISSYTHLHEHAAGKTQVTLPPVFVVCTHADKYADKPEDAKQVARELWKTLTRKENPSRKHIMCGIYTVNNKLSGNGEIKDESAKKLKAKIEEISKSLPQMNEDVPLRWLQFEEELSNLVQKKNKRYIDVKEAMRLADKHQVNTQSNEFTTLLDYLHDLKTIIYFKDTRTVFIDTQWLVNMFVKVITVMPCEEWSEDYADSWRKLEEDGVLERALVEHVWSDIVDDKITVDSLLLIMEKFSLICRWRLNEEQMYLVPSMLCNSKEREDVDVLLTDEQSSTMAIHFKSVHLPLGIFPRLFVAIAEHGKKEWLKLRQPKLCPNFFRYEY